MRRKSGGDERVVVGTSTGLDRLDTLGIDRRVEEMLPSLARREMRVL